VDDEPDGLSVNADCNVIVTSYKANTIRVFTSEGTQVKVINLQRSDIVHPAHTIQLTSNKYVVCHGTVIGGVSDPVHRVCVVDDDGKVLQSFGGSKGSGENQLNGPDRLAVVNGFIFVVDFNNHRVIMLSPTLRYIRTVVSGLSGWPDRMCFDEQSSRLYVDESEMENNEWTTGRVNVFNVGN
jgi:hypothetical protein